jgi:Uma2 family endonuclease
LLNGSSSGPKCHDLRREDAPPRKPLSRGSCIGNRKSATVNHGIVSLRARHRRVTTKTLISIEEYDALPEKEGVKYELNEGELITVAASPRLLHNRVRDRTGRSLATFVEDHKLGEVTMETDFRLSEGVVRIPDIAFIRAERLPGIDPRQRIEGAPDLAVEVVSPNDDPNDLVLKIQQYLQSGARAVWVLYPEAHLAYLYKPGERPEVRELHQNLDDPELLPGFSLPLSKVFASESF